MLSKVEVYTERGAMLTLPMSDTSSGYEVKDIDGLDPNKANVMSSSFALLDGEEYQNSRGEKRNIIIKLGYSNASNLSVLERRSKLYNFFMPKARVTLRFYLAGFPTVDIVGRVETFSSPMFAQDPEATISILCHAPAFYTQETVQFSWATTSTPASEAINYRGSIAGGFTFKMTLDRALNNFTINHNFANGVGRTLSFAGGLLAGDLIEVVTIPRQKGAWVTRAGVRTSVLYGVAPNSDWIDLFPGENTIRVYTEGTPIAYTIEYRELFGGL